MTAGEMALTFGESAGVKLESVDGIPTWEAFPSVRHQKHVFRIQRSIRQQPGHENACECLTLSDVYVRFPEGSLKRPDIAVFCREPSEQNEAVTMLPEAVIEVVSPGYEAKDLAIGVPFYLRMQIKDIIVFDPETGLVRHFRPGYSEAHYQTPITIPFACGCEATV